MGRQWGEPRGDRHRLPSENRGGHTASRLQEGARTHFSKLKRGKRMLFLMKIVKFSASIMTGLCEQRRKGQGSREPSPGATLPGGHGPTSMWPRPLRSEGQRTGVAGEPNWGEAGHTAGGCPQDPLQAERCRLPHGGPGAPGWGLSSRRAQALTFPPCPPRQGTSPGSHRCGALSCNSRSGR